MRSTLLPLGVLAALLACGKTVDGPDVDFSQPPYAAIEVSDGAVVGPADAWVTIVEFVDYACPHCATAQPVVEELRARHPADVRVAVRMFPLPQHEPGASQAARAALCAQEQGRFWELHASLFEHQAEFSDAQLASYAAAIEGLDLSVWRACYVSPGTADAVKEDVALGLSLGVLGTPRFFINGKLVENYGLDGMEYLVEHARAAAEASGEPRAEYYQSIVLRK